MSTVAQGKLISIEYTAFVEGRVVDTTQGKGAYQFVQGTQQILPFLQEKIEGLHIGDNCEFVLEPENGYGVLDPKAFREIPKSEIQTPTLHLGMVLQEKQPDGSVKIGRVAEIKGDSVILNFNHPMAGKRLHYKITIVNIQDAP